MQAPKKPHLDGVQRTLCYVRATLDYALFYVVGVPVELYGYTDVDWAGWIGYLPVALCFHLGVLLSLGVARSP